jgi:hypothetical protein
MIGYRRTLFTLSAALLLQARSAAAQVTAPPAPAVATKLGVTLPSPDSFGERFADALGVAYGVVTRTPQSGSRAAVAREWIRRLPNASATAAVKPTREIRSCPMPVATIDPNRMAPIPIVVSDSTGDQRAAVVGRVTGCTNPLAP